MGKSHSDFENSARSLEQPPLDVGNPPDFFEVQQLWGNYAPGWRMPALLCALNASVKVDPEFQPGGCSQREPWKPRVEPQNGANSLFVQRCTASSPYYIQIAAYTRFSFSPCTYVHMHLCHDPYSYISLVAVDRKSFCREYVENMSSTCAERFISRVGR